MRSVSLKMEPVDMFNKFRNLSTTKKVSISLFVAFFFMLLGAYAAILSSESAHELRIQKLQAIDLHHPIPDLHNSQPSNTEISTTNKSERSHQEIKIVDDWFNQVGFSTAGERAYDEQYTDTQLQALADSGDFVAIDTLLKRIQQSKLKDFEQKMLAFNKTGDTEGMTSYLNTLQEEGKEDEIILAEKGIIYGSFNSITAMSRLLIPYFSSSDTPEIRAEKKGKLIEYLAYLNLLKLRGAGGLYGVDSYEKIRLVDYKEQYEESPLSDDDNSAIEKRAKELYDHYQSERDKLGLGNFDNTKPAEVERFLGE